MTQLQTPISRIENYVKEYNEARKVNNTPRAIEMGKLAVRDAADELKRDTVNESYRIYYRTVIDEIGAFLANPVAPKPARASGATEDKIKSTDWFGAPIPDLTLNDIAGLKEVRDQFVLNVFAAIDPKYSAIFRKYRGNDRKLQILLYGPSGTGKTHAVRCLAGALGCKIAVVQVKDVMANLVGDGAKIIAEVFEQANKLEKCIIFFDEIDAIAASREGDESTHTKEQLTTLLTYMDGFTSKAKPGQVRIVIAATNRPWALDSAVLRGGRFDTKIYVPLPDLPAREQLVRVALGKDPKVKNRVDIPCAPDVTVEWLASRFKGYSGADIKSICRQAASLPMKREILALGNGKPCDDKITRDDFETVFAKYILSTSDEELMAFDAYRLNMKLDRKYIDFKLDQIILDLYNDEEIEGFEARMLKDAMETAAFKDKFGSKYDLSFIPAKLSAQGY